MAGDRARAGPQAAARAPVAARGAARGGARQLLEALDSRRYESFVNRFGRALRARPRRGAGPWSVARARGCARADRRPLRLVPKAARRIDADSPPDDYHRLRIRGKRLRYTLEFLGDLYPDDTKPLVKRLTALQDILGEHHDAVVAIERLRDLAAAGDDRLAPPTAFAMGEIAERYRRRAAELEPEARAAYKRDHREAVEGAPDASSSAAAHRPTGTTGWPLGSRAPRRARRSRRRRLDARVDAVLADLLDESVALELATDWVAPRRGRGRRRARSSWSASSPSVFPPVKSTSSMLAASRTNQRGGSSPPASASTSSVRRSAFA